jgi:peptide deformylase
MIVTDISRLRVKCASTSIEQCDALGIFSLLEKELKDSKTTGIGLAAPQIGHNLRACIIRLPEHKDPEGHIRQGVHLNMINPVIEKGYDKRVVNDEKCLSLPGIAVDTERYDEVLVSWLDYDEKQERKAVFYGLEAVCVQHEVQHLDGELIIDHAAVKKEKVGRNDPCSLCLKEGIKIKWKKCKKHNPSA